MATKDMDASLEGERKQLVEGRAILIAGPTASGKSALALDLAEACDGVIINADSMQLYEDLRIVSARPSIAEEGRVPHRLYGFLPASTAFSTGAWLRLATQEIETVEAEGRTPILVGGTGLYFKALTEGFAELPEIPEEIRDAARELADREGVEGLKKQLSLLGDEAAAQSLADPQRLTRALEVLQATGKPLSLWQQKAQSAPFLTPDSCTRIVLGPPRSWLHSRIEQRARLMLEEAGVAEVKRLLALNLSEKLPAMRAIGVSETRDYLSGTTDLEETVHRLTVATRQYAKRQETWFRNQMPDWQRVDPSKGIDNDCLWKAG
ncbi:tRNA (adenosine(37)-N6)-dimethylallyltransferase MiaA [uncultured Roseibium sp.]|uniref:tRNA (adenosine(37)-N6)-dimethylallyltransferase MiaA n=1 Tax=uncultured Roseibium sp. TaxID=1936171 RepID=UPI00344F843A